MPQKKRPLGVGDPNTRDLRQEDHEWGQPRVQSNTLSQQTNKQIKRSKQKISATVQHRRGQLIIHKSAIRRKKVGVVYEKNPTKMKPHGY